MEKEDQEVEARSDAGAHAVGRYTLAFLKKTKSFWPSSIILGAGETGEVWGLGTHKKLG